MTKVRVLADLPVLAGWLTFPEAARALGVSRQRFYQMVEEGKITTAVRVGPRPYHLVEEQEIDKLRGQRDKELSVA